MRTARRFILLTLALAVIGPGHFLSLAFAQFEDQTSVKVRADGFAPGEGRSAEATALADAELAAVDLAILNIVGDRWMDRLDSVYTQSDSYVRTSRPLETVRTADGVQVRAEVYVYEPQLRRDIAAVLFNSLAAKPAVAVLLGEQIEGYRNWTVGDGAAQRYFEKRFRDAGFEVVDTASRYTAEVLMEYQAGSPNRIAGFGRDARVEIVIRGDVTAETESPAGMVNVNRVSAKLEIDVIRPSDGLVVERFESAAAVNSPDARMGGEQAIEDGAAKIIQDVLVSSMIAYATQPPPADFVVSVRLPTEGPWLTRARNGIGARFPKAQLFDLHHSPGQAKFRIALDISLSALVHGLTDSAFDDFQLLTKRAVGRELDLELVPLR